MYHQELAVGNGKQKNSEGSNSDSSGHLEDLKDNNILSFPTQVPMNNG